MIMEKDYKTLYISGLENFPKNKDELIAGLENKKIYCKLYKGEKELDILSKRIDLILKWIKRKVNERYIPHLTDNDFYRVGYTEKNDFSIQIWTKYNEKDKISYKKDILYVSKKLFNFR